MHVHARVLVGAYVYMSVCFCVFVCACMHVSVSLLAGTYVYVSVCVFACLCV